MTVDNLIQLLLTPGLGRYKRKQVYTDLAKLVANDPKLMNQAFSTLAIRNKTTYHFRKLCQFINDQY